MASKKLKRYIDGCRIRSFVEGRELKRDLSKPLEDGKFPVMMKTVKREKTPTEVPVIQTGVSQVRVSSKTDFKNPFFKNDDWLLNKIAAFEEQFEDDEENEGHSDISDIEDNDDSMNFQSSIKY